MPTTDDAHGDLRRRLAACLAVVLLAAAAWATRLDGPINLHWDGGAYFLLGAALAQGEGYRILSEPGLLPSSVHPPLLPALVAVHMLGLGSTDHLVVGHALRLTMALVSIAYAAAIFWLLSAYIARGYAMFAALFALVLSQAIYFAEALYAETLFGLLTVLFFILQRHRTNAACFAASGICAVLAYGARTAGIALLAAWVVDNVIRRDVKRTLVALAIAAGAVLPWLGWIKAAESSPAYREPAYAYQTAPYLYFNVSYARNLSLKDPWAPEQGPLTPRGIVERLIDGAQTIPLTVGRTLSSWQNRRSAWLLAGLVILGLLVQVRQRQVLAVSYVVLSLVVVASTPFPEQHVRYVLPLYPFLALALFIALSEAGTAVRGRWPKAPRVVREGPTWLVLALMATLGLRATADLFTNHYDQVAYEHHGLLTRYRLYYYAPDGRALDQAIDWLSPRLQPADVLAVPDAQWAYLRTGRKAVIPPLEIDGGKAQRLVDSVPVRYLLAPTTGAYSRYVQALLEANPTAWIERWRSADGALVVYQRR